MNRKKLRAVGIVLGLSVVALAGMLPRGVQAKPRGYLFTALAFLGDPAPGGGVFTNDFEGNAISHRGDVFFGADLATAAGGVFIGEGLFFVQRGQITPIARPGQSAPGGGVFDDFFLGPIALNDGGDMAFSFILDPFTLPFGVHAGVYRFSHSAHTLSAVVVPNVTPAPGGGTFAGAAATVLNNQGDIAFSGIFPTPNGIHVPGEPYIGLGSGLFLADRKGQIFGVVLPGDPAPGGGMFDSTFGSSINAKGDIAFGAHVAGEECITAASQSGAIFCGESLYVRPATTGEIQSIAHQGDPAPGGGVFRHAFGPVLNSHGDMVFLGDLTTEDPATPKPDFNKVLGVYLHSKGNTLRVAGPGDPMPGGGHFVTASFIVNHIYLNNPGDVVFSAVLDTDVDADHVLDTGLFVWSHGSLRLVVRTGTFIPGVGPIDRLAFGPSPIPPPAGVNAQPAVSGSAIINDRGQILFGGTLEGERGVLLVATPSP